MTITEFNKTGFGAGDKAEYDGKVYDIASIDFKEQLIGLIGITQGSEEIEWVRCENVRFIAGS